MSAWGKFFVAAAAPLLLGGCLWGPGKFTSDLALRKNGTFVLDYRGEILLQMPDYKGPAPLPWENDMARCYADGRAEIVDTEVRTDPVDGSDEKEVEKRACTAAELRSSRRSMKKKARKRSSSAVRKAKTWPRCWACRALMMRPTAALPRT
ncbi:hypothetical protein D3M59_08810 [Sphingomonas edaphi]|uniref:Lipoprotein n=1 Tax=Sphingomonas edaphi TaxID=2315689 RepID=A0A418Q0J4_9SPHN|nr:hypothetical protein D3M59_08810 [Sphingomonas edaphi]